TGDGAATATTAADVAVDDGGLAQHGGCVRRLQCLLGGTASKVPARRTLCPGHQLPVLDPRFKWPEEASPGIPYYRTQPTRANPATGRHPPNNLNPARLYPRDVHTVPSHTATHHPPPDNTYQRQRTSTPPRPFHSQRPRPCQKGRVADPQGPPPPLSPGDSD